MVILYQLKFYEAKLQMIGSLGSHFILFPSIFGPKLIGIMSFTCYIMYSLKTP
jgi:hypothetical protein